MSNYKNSIVWVAIMAAFSLLCSCESSKDEDPFQWSCHEGEKKCSYDNRIVEVCRDGAFHSLEHCIDSCQAGECVILGCMSDSECGPGER